MRCILFLAFVAIASARFCMRDEAPTKVKINDKGVPELTCERPECNMADSKMHSCTYYQSACPNNNEWVSGIHENDQKFGMACCRSPFLSYSRVLGSTKLFPGDVFAGGSWQSKSGSRHGFDVVSNIEKVTSEDGSNLFRVTVARVTCPQKAPIVQPSKLIAAKPENRYSAQRNQVAGNLQNGLALGLNGFDEDLDQRPFNNQQWNENAQFHTEQIAQTNEIIPLNNPGMPFQGGFQQGGFQGLAAPAGIGALPALGGVGAGACFAEDTQVTTETGPKMIKDLKIGESVLTVNSGRFSFSPVESWLHKYSDKMVEFLEMRMEDGSHLTVTPTHFVYHGECDASADWSLSFAKDIRPGQCVFKVAGESMVPVVVLSSESVIRKGAYGPMTANTDIVVNDVAASCYAIVKDSTLLNSLLSMTQAMDRMCDSAMRAVGFKSGPNDLFNEMPASLTALMNMADVVFPANWKIMG